MGTQSHQTLRPYHCSQCVHWPDGHPQFWPHFPVDQKGSPEKTGSSEHLVERWFHLQRDRTVKQQMSQSFVVMRNADTCSVSGPDTVSPRRQLSRPYTMESCTRGPARAAWALLHTQVYEVWQSDVWVHKRQKTVMGKETELTEAQHSEVTAATIHHVATKPVPRMPVNYQRDRKLQSS